MAGKKSRNKGKTGERKLAEFLRDLGYPLARRAQQYSGAEGTSDIAGAIPGVHIECKYQGRPAIFEAMRQAETDCHVGNIPMVWTKVVKRGPAQEPWLVTMHGAYLVMAAERILAALPPAELRAVIKDLELSLGSED